MTAKVELTITRLANGGDGVAHDANGRVVFVPGGLPGDVVEVQLTTEKKRFARAEIERVLEAGPDRIAPPCPERARGCGGCTLQELSLDAQREAKLGFVRDALERLGGIESPLVEAGPALPEWGFRTTVRVLARKGRPAYRRNRSHDPVLIDSCAVAHPLVQQVMDESRFSGAKEVTIRVGAQTGECLVIGHPRADRFIVAPGIAVIGEDELADAGPGSGVPGYHEKVAGRFWRISAPSFFQTRVDGAELLVDRVRAAIETLDAPPFQVIDAYGGVGLLSAAAPDDADVIVVEANRFATADAKINLAEREGASRIVTRPVEEWTPEPADVVIADPSRRGLGDGGAEVVCGAGAGMLVLVSCDAAALGRDAGLLAARGYAFERTEVLDLFPHTPHIEAVTIFRRTAAAR